MKCPNFESYIFSDFQIDEEPRGVYIFGQSTSRLISCIDIFSELAKGVIGTLASIAASVFRIVVGALALVCMIPSSIAWFIAHGLKSNNESYWEEKTVHCAKFGIENCGKSLTTFFIGIPISLLWRVGIIAADLLGIFLPEIGRQARQLTKILIAVMQASQEPPPDARTPRRLSRRASKRQFSGFPKDVPYNHNYTPQAELIGGLVTLKILEAFKLKSAASFEDMKISSIQLYEGAKNKGTYLQPLSQAKWI